MNWAWVFSIWNGITIDSLQLTLIPPLLVPMLTVFRPLADEIIRRLSHSSAGSEMNTMRPASTTSMFDDVSVLLCYFQIHPRYMGHEFSHGHLTGKQCLLSLLLILLHT